MKDVIKLPFGKLENGREVSLYKITNDIGASLTVCDFGAIIQSLILPDKNNELVDIVLGFDELSPYYYDEAYIGACVGRYANRLRGNKLEINGEIFSLDSNEGENVLHGGLCGFNKVFYQVEKRDKSTIVFHYLSKNGESGFPGNLNFSISYTFDDACCLTIEYRAVTDTKTIVNFTNHSYFNLDGHNYGTLDNHKIKLQSSFYTPSDSKLIPTGEILSISGTALDLRTLSDIKNKLVEMKEQGMAGYDHNYLIDGYEKGKLSETATVISSHSGISMDLYTTEPAVQFYTANALNSDSGKDDATYGTNSAFCLETQHCPNSPEFSHFPSTVLNVGEEFISKTIIKFKTIL